MYKASAINKGTGGQLTGNQGEPTQYMHHEHISKVPDSMMKAAKTPGQGITPGNPDLNAGGVGKVGSMAERYKNNNFAGGLY